MDFPGRLIASIIAIILILVFPLQYIAGLNSEDMDTLVDESAHRFTDTIRDKGCLDEQTYENFINYLDTTGEMYDLALQDIHPVTGEETANMNDGGFMNSPYHHASHASFINTEKQLSSASYTCSGMDEAVLHDSVSDREIQSFSSHTHTDNCYAGNLHVCDGINCEYEGDAIVIMLTNAGLYYSNNGINWINGMTNYGICDVTYGNNMFVTLEVGSQYNTYNKVYISTDGINWTEKDTVITGLSHDVNGTLFQNIAYSSYNEYFYATLFTKSQYGGWSTLIIASKDGINWEKVYTIPHPNRVDKIAIGNSALYVQYKNDDDPVYDKGYIRFSMSSKTLPNLSSYSKYQLNNFTGSNIFHQRSQNSVFIQDNIYGLNYTDVHYGNDIEVKLYRGSSSTSLYVNGERRNDHNLESINAKTSAGNMIYFGDKFMFNFQGESNIYMSSDGVNWTKVPHPAVSSHTKYACNAPNRTGEIDRGPCSKIGKYYDSNGVEVHPICDQVVTSISATNPTQTVKKGESIITTATATYLDGHTGTVSCTSNFNTNLIGTQTVTLTYTGLVGNAKTNGTRTCTLSVTVKPNKSLTSISATPASQTVKKYAYPSITVKAHYNDGTSKTLTSSQYKVIGFNPATLGLQKLTVSYTEDGITKSVVINVTVEVLDKKCPRCQIVYDMNHDDSDPGCPNCKQLVTGIEVTPNNIELTQGASLPITVIALYNDGSKNEVSGWISNYKAERLGIQIVTVEYGGYATDIIVWVNEGLVSCPICGNEYPPSENECPECANQVISISASPKVITVVQYQQIPLKVTAYFANGSSRIVDDWSIDQATLTPGTYTASVSYKGISDTITLTVLSINNVVCPICGANYDSSENLRGCPVCSVELVEIEAYLTSGSNLVQLGTSPALAVILIFRDGHREFAADGYTLENFNPHELGIQTVRVVYREFYTTVAIEVVNILDALTCPNGHVYYKNQDGTDPGCPFCYEDENVSKILYYDITYTSEILDKVYNIGIYNFSQGNYISVILTKRDKSLMYRLQNTFFSTSMLGRKRKFIYGGEVYQHE